jgi:hypothetical protein
VAWGALLVVGLITAWSCFAEERSGKTASRDGGDVHRAVPTALAVNEITPATCARWHDAVGLRVPGIGRMVECKNLDTDPGIACHATRRTAAVARQVGKCSR